MVIIVRVHLYFLGVMGHDALQSALLAKLDAALGEPKHT
jgi:hypothetical protein